MKIGLVFFRGDGVRNLGRVEKAGLFQVLISHAAAEDLAEGLDEYALDTLEMRVVLDENGLLPQTAASGPAVFAVYDKEQSIQYVGFSSNLSKSIEKLFYRRPETAYYYKAVELETVDQELMMSIRNGWFDSLGDPPVGNRNPVEKEAWQEPTQVVSNSEGGMMVAAQEEAAMKMTQIRNRGCKMDFAAEPVLLQKGVIEFVTLTPEEMERIRLEKEKMAESIKQFTFENDDGEEEVFEVMIGGELKTNGGYMYDVTLIHDSRETNHRVIVGKMYYKHGEFEPEQVLGAAFGFILKKNIPRQTEGILSSTQFSPNYFSVAEMHQVFPEFEEMMPLRIDGDSFWRFRRVEQYGYRRQVDDAQKLSMQFSNTNE